MKNGTVYKILKSSPESSPLFERRRNSIDSHLPPRMVSDDIDESGEFYTPFEITRSVPGIKKSEVASNNCSCSCQIT